VMDIEARDVGESRDGLKFAQFLALILFFLAAVIVLVAAYVSFSIFAGERFAIGILAGAGPVAWMLGWLGMRLWSGRPLPRWFLSAHALGTFGFLAAFGWARGHRLESLVLVGMMISVLFKFRSINQGDSVKPPAPEAFDLLA
jgi:hypothetical protein